MLNLQYAKTKTKYEVEFTKASDHVVTLKGNIPIKEEGFILSRIDHDDKWDYTDYTTIYREIEGGVQFSNDGSKYIPPKKNVTVSISWNDDNNVMYSRPSIVDVEVKKNGKKFEIVALSEANNWKKVYEDVLAEDEFTVEANDIPDYKTSIYGTQVVYSMDLPEPYEPSIDDLTEAIAEIYDMIDQNSNDILVTQEAVAEIYEMIGE